MTRVYNPCQLIGAHATSDAAISLTAEQLARVENPCHDMRPSSQSPIQCLCCGGDQLREFYRVDKIPAQSNAMLTTHEEGIAFPLAQLRLSFCPACGFITNTAFDQAAADAEFGYEASQAASATFGSFAKRLATHWIERYGVRKKHVIEIGCGQGEFLALMCQLGDNHGIGVDPRFKPDRHPAPQDQRLQFVRDLYSSAYKTLPVDFICCRHTLEHIPQAGTFVQMVRDVIGDRNAVVGFEVPDTLRVLREGAFWDIYHEHCSYFTPGSLARLFRANRFDVLDARLEYDRQYLILEAQPTMDATTESLPAEVDLAAVTNAVNEWPNICKNNMNCWRDVIAQSNSAGKGVALWGSGSKAVGFLSTLGLMPDQVPCVVDINPYKQGTFLPATGQPVVAPEFLREMRPGVVIIMNPVYRKEIQESLDALGVDAEVLTL